MQCVARSSQPAGPLAVISGDQFWNRRARERDGETSNNHNNNQAVAWQPANIQIKHKQPQFVSTDTKATWKQDFKPLLLPFSSAFTPHAQDFALALCLWILLAVSQSSFHGCHGEFGANVSVCQCSVRIFTYPHQFSVYFRKFEIYMLVFTPLVALILNKDNIISLGTLHMTTKSRAVHPHRVIIS